MIIRGLAGVVIVTSLLHLIKNIYIPGLSLICISLIMVFFFFQEKSTTNNKERKTLVFIGGILAAIMGVMEIVVAIF
jgi:hypothetical protein